MSLPGLTHALSPQTSPSSPRENGAAVQGREQDEEDEGWMSDQSAGEPSSSGVADKARGKSPKHKGGASKGSRKRKAGNVGHPKASKRAKTTEPAVNNTSISNAKGSRKRKADTPAVADKPTKRAKVVKSTPALTSASTPATTAPSTATAVEGEGRTLRNRETLVKSFKVRQSAT